MPRRDDKSVIIRHDMPELSALLNGTFHRSVNAAGGLGELEGCGAHPSISYLPFSKGIAIRFGR